MGAAKTDWNRLAERRLARILKAAQAKPGLRRLGPKAKWQLDLNLVGSTAMTRLNAKYRGKRYPTDVLSFPAPEPFRGMGRLGELVICLPTLKKQARELGHKPELELDVLLTHGLLHLLGFDHEKGPGPARAQYRWEEKLLGPRAAKAGLIARAK
jgi:rRNA maturation RNase YbeY